MCLMKKGCSYQACELNKLKHMYEHLQGTNNNEAESAKKSHCMFINPYNAEMRCLTCRIEIYDLAQYQKSYALVLQRRKRNYFNRK